MKMMVRGSVELLGKAHVCAEVPPRVTTKGVDGSCARSHCRRLRAKAWSATSTFDVFTGVGPDNSLERLTERGVRLVTDHPGDNYQLFVTLFK